jgi:hypothetical protein
MLYERHLVLDKHSREDRRSHALYLSASRCVKEKYSGRADMQEIITFPRPNLSPELLEQLRLPPECVVVSLPALPTLRACAVSDRALEPLNFWLSCHAAALAPDVPLTTLVGIASPKPP